MLLDSTRSGLEGTGLMKKTGRANPPLLSWEDIGFICEGLAFASRLLWTAIKDVTDEYSLGRAVRGSCAWSEEATCRRSI